jgi:membrane protease YdiL (CAAX protease family)
MLQQGLLSWWDGMPVPLGILIVAVIFGACHWITHLYFLLATITGIYLGWLYQYSGSLVEPVLAHALYDFIALVVITRGDIEPGSEPLSEGDLEDRGEGDIEAGDGQPE